MYDLGRQARKAAFPTEACNLSKNDWKRSWWIAGWHDEDMETAAKKSTEE
jgi:hypothetical protein